MLKVCFDCDDTLYDLAWPFLQTMKEYVPQAFDGSYDLEQMYQDYRYFGDYLFDLLQAGVITPDDSGILRIVKLCEKYGFELDLLDSWHFQQRYKQFQYMVKMNPDFYAFLKDLPAKKAILTNGQTEHQLKKVQSLKADQLMDPANIFVSQALGYRKPDRRVFDAMMAKMNEDPQDWYYVGDSYDNDMAGAKGAGMKTIHFNRHHQKEGDCSDYTVYSEQELMDLLKELTMENS